MYMMSRATAVKRERPSVDPAAAVGSVAVPSTAREERGKARAITLSYAWYAIETRAIGPVWDQTETAARKGVARNITKQQSTQRFTISSILSI